MSLSDTSTSSAFTRRALLGGTAAAAVTGLLAGAEPGRRALAQDVTPLAAVAAPSTGAAWLDAIVPDLDALVEETMARHGTPGMSLAITDRDGVRLTREYGFRNLAAQAPITPDVLFEFGSIGKAFTAVCLLQLAEEGRIDLQAPVVTYLPWFAVQSGYALITVHHLLTHTSGLVAGEDFAPDATAEVYGLRSMGVAGPPGKASRYSNVGYKALGLVLEAVTGQSYREVMQERILTPLEMDESTSAITTAMRHLLATGYTATFDDRPLLLAYGLVEAPWFETSTGDGSMAASARSLTAFLRMLLNGGAGPRGPLISADSLAQMLTPHASLLEVGGLPYGYAMFILDLNGTQVIGHNGGMLGYSSSMYGMPVEGLGVVALINGPGDPQSIVLAALQMMQASRAGQPLPPVPPVPDPAVVENAADYAGVYTGDTDEITLEADGDALTLVSGGDRLPLIQSAPDVFLINDPVWGLFPLVAVRNATGQVTELTHGPTWLRGAAYDGPTVFAAPEAWAAYAGHYRSHNPWQPNFRIGVRKGELWLFWPKGGEERLQETADGFQPSPETNSPLRLRFDWEVNGLAQRVRWNDGNATHYRFFTP